MTKKKSLFFLLSVVYQFFIYTFFLFKKEWGLGFFLFEILHLLPFIIFAKKRLFVTWAKTGIAVLLATFFFVRLGSGNPISLLTLFFLNPIIAFEFVSGELFSLRMFLQTPSRILHNFQKTIRSLATLLDAIIPILKSGKFVSSKNLSKIIVGSVLAVPIVWILLILFQSVDTQFLPSITNILTHLVPDWLKNFDLENIMPSVIEYGLFAFYLLATFPTDKPVKAGRISGSYVIELITTNILVAFVFYLFFSFQIKTFTRMILDFQSMNINPKLFVREGFYQLFFASLIGTGVTLLLNAQLVKDLTKKKKLVAISTITLLLVGVLLVSLLAGQRVYVYQYLHGLTVIRIWGMLLLVAFWTTIASLFLHIFQKISFVWFLQVSLFSFLTILSAVQIMNIDYVVAKWGNPRVNEKKDQTYIGNLSLDATPVWREELDTISTEILGICQTDGVEFDNNIPKLPENFPNFNTSQTECQTLVTKYEEKSHLISAILSTTRMPKISCSLSQNKPWQSYNHSVYLGEKYICQKEEGWKNFLKQYSDLKRIIEYQNSNQK